MTTKEEIVVRWSWEDIQAIHQDWTQEDCEDAMSEVAEYVHERIVELGNEVLAQCVYEIVETKWETEQ